MLTNRERTIFMLTSAPLAVAFAALIALIGEAQLKGTDFQVISIFLYAASVLFAMADIGMWLFFIARAAFNEGSATRFMVAVTQDDRLFENRAFGDSIIRTSVKGNVTDNLVISESEGNVPHITQNGAKVIHLSPEPVVEQMVSRDVWNQMLHVYRQGKVNGKG